MGFLVHEYDLGNKLCANKVVHVLGVGDRRVGIKTMLECVAEGFQAPAWIFLSR